MSLNRLFSSKYALQLGIYDHLNECLIIANEVKKTKNATLDKDTCRERTLKYHLDCELSDLYLLLSEYLDDGLIEERREKFITKDEEDYNA